jgi:hypothetical protein
LIEQIALTAHRMNPKFGSPKNYARQRGVAMNGRDNTTSSRRSDMRRFPSIAVTRLRVRLVAIDGRRVPNLYQLAAARRVNVRAVAGRLERICRLKEALGLTLAEISELVQVEDERNELRAAYRESRDPAEKVHCFPSASQVILALDDGYIRES